MGSSGSVSATRSDRHRVPRRLVRASAALAVAAVLSGCSAELTDQWARLGLPEPAAADNERIIGNFWVWTWVAALAVGVVVWGLILWSALAYRRRSDELPPQTRYNVPIEALYTVVPFIIIAALFFWTYKTTDEVTRLSGDATVKINVIGQKWAWTFNYVNEDVYDVGTSAVDNERSIPTLYLPVGETVEFQLESPDVNHSFWVPSFYYKMDVIPGVTNRFELTPTREGTFAGKCAELCGTYHSRMLFNVRVVDRATYDQRIADLRAVGQTGQIRVEDLDYDYGTTGRGPQAVTGERGQGTEEGSE